MGELRNKLDVIEAADFEGVGGQEPGR